MLLHAEGVPTSRAAESALGYLMTIIRHEPPPDAKGPAAAAASVPGGLHKWTSLHCRILADTVMAAVGAFELP